MINANSDSSGLTWVAFALLTVVSWGVYGVFLHTGQVAMEDPDNGRYKAFLFVGIAYFLTAVLAPLALLLMNGAAITGFRRYLLPYLTAEGAGGPPQPGFLGGWLGKAHDPFLVLRGGPSPEGFNMPALVMSIVFAGAPVINAVYALILHPPAGGWGKVPWPFYLGILLAALGGCLVTFYKPNPPAASRAKPATVETAPAAPSPRSTLTD